MKKRMLSLLLALVMVLSLLPVTALAVGGHDGQVHGPKPTALLGKERW